MRPLTRLLFTLIGVLIALWVLRGVGILSFLPGIVLWFLIIGVFAIAIINSLQSAR
jgi:peptidoglycan/LPS O-acetylase OafA/YrhL